MLFFTCHLVLPKTTDNYCWMQIKRKQRRPNRQLKKAELADLLRCYPGFVSMFLIKQVQLCQL